MDGLDGLVAGYSLIVASMCFLLNIGSELSFISYLSAAIIGTTLGFLKFNANPARIFLGDTGSLTLGYLISGLVISISGEVSSNPTNKVQAYSNTIDLTFIFIALALPIADTIRVIIVRLMQRKHIFLADTSHLHHLLYSKNIEHKTAVVIIHLFSVMFVLLAIYYAKISESNALIIFAVLLISLLSIKQILNFIISKEHLLDYVRVYKKVPDLLPRIYKIFLLPLFSMLLIALFIILLISSVSQGQPYYKYFLLFIIPALLYSSRTLKKNNYYAELLVFVNIILFFAITGFNGFFYKLYPVPIFEQININQIMIIALSGMIIFFVLFKERVAHIIQHFLTGTDLTLAVLILSIYIATQFINLPVSYMISDTLLRSFLVFLFYKIIIVTSPRLHFSLYYVSFLIAVIAVLKSLF
jgi:UDP-GlcNAc:undecaprenyl-phosphate GlcNAc-1-phosphate transferase